MIFNNGKKGKLLICLMAIILLVSPVFSLEVDEVEIRKTARDEVTFINYEGPHQLVDSLEAIKGIGTDLKAAPVSGSAGTSNMYYVVHAVDPNAKTGFDADIFFIGKNAGVDHIRNLRVIIASYLSSAYKYSYSDAYTVATFVTIYNAVYRGNIDYFSQHYKSVVLKNITKQNVGLSTRWDEWAGQTAIVIPLSGNSSVSPVDTSAISDKNIIASVKETEQNKGIEQRKDLTNLKEREAEQANKDADKAKEQADKAKEQAKQSEKELVDLKIELDEKKEKTKKLEEKTNKTVQEKKELETKKQETAKTEAEIAKKTQETENKKKEAEVKEEEAKKAEDFAVKKEEEARADRQSIADDQKDMISTENNTQNKALENTIAGLRVVDNSALLSEIVMVDTTNSKVVKTSTLNAIRGREIVSTGSSYIAIAGSEKTGSTVRLVQIDPVTLDIIKQGSDEIATNSVLVQNNTDLYAVIKTQKGNFLGRFDQNLKLQAQSEIAVSPVTPITIDRSTIVVQQENGTMVLLQTANLKKK